MARCEGVDAVRRCEEFARRHSIPVAIRGGGHSYAGFGVADGALQIDLGAFNTVTVDQNRRVASVGGGTRIKELLTATLAVGLYTPMGGCGDVGVAGLALAGGDTSPRGLLGTACDNVIGAQLVTADGDVLELGPGRNDNLFWAIRGGGGNFGVVTRLDFRLHPLRPQHSASFQFVNDIAGAMRTFGEPFARRRTRSARRFVSRKTGAVASCGHYGNPAAATAYHAKWKATFRSVEPQIGTRFQHLKGRCGRRRRSPLTARSSRA
jgi:FAD/FMN-containing dehydrogenase